MEFVRPELRQIFWRYSDAIIGVVISVLGVGWALSSVGFMVILGYSVFIAGALLIFAGIQRGRFKGDRDGVGVVSVDEGQVTYFGPFDGGSVHVDDLMQVDIDQCPTGGRGWLLLPGSGDPLCIPMNAIGADALFDVFNSLEGMRTHRLIALLEQSANDHVMVWRQKQPASD